MPTLRSQYEIIFSHEPHKSLTQAGVVPTRLRTLGKMPGGVSPKEMEEKWSIHCQMLARALYYSVALSSSSSFRPLEVQWIQSAWWCLGRKSMCAPLRCARLCTDGTKPPSCDEDCWDTFRCCVDILPMYDNIAGTPRLFRSRLLFFNFTVFIYCLLIQFDWQRTVCRENKAFVIWFHTCWETNDTPVTD